MLRCDWISEWRNIITGKKLVTLVIGGTLTQILIENMAIAANTLNYWATYLVEKRYYRRKTTPVIGETLIQVLADSKTIGLAR